MSTVAQTISRKVLEQRIVDFIQTTKNIETSSSELSKSDIDELNSLLIPHIIRKNIRFLVENNQTEEEIYNSIYDICVDLNFNFGIDDTDELKLFIREYFSYETTINSEVVNPIYEEIIRGKKKITKSDILKFKNELNSTLIDQFKDYSNQAYSFYRNSSHIPKIKEFVSSLGMMLETEQKEKIHKPTRTFDDAIDDFNKYSLGGYLIAKDKNGNYAINTAPSGIPDAVLKIGNSYCILVATTSTDTRRETDTVIKHPMSAMLLIDEIEQLVQEKEQTVKQVILPNKNRKYSNSLTIEQLENSIHKIEGILENDSSLKRYINSHINEPMHFNGSNPYDIEFDIVTGLDLSNLRSRYTSHEIPRTINSGYVVIKKATYDEVKFKNSPKPETRNYLGFKDAEDFEYVKVLGTSINMSKLHTHLKSSLKENLKGKIDLIQKIESGEILKVDTDFDVSKMTGRDITNVLPSIMNFGDKKYFKSQGEKLYRDKIRHLNKNIDQYLIDKYDPAECAFNKKRIVEDEDFDRIKETMDRLNISVYYDGHVKSFFNNPKENRFNSDKYTNEEFRAALQLFSFTEQLISNKGKDGLLWSAPSAIDYIEVLSRTARFDQGKKEFTKDILDIDNINKSFKSIMKEFVENNLFEPSRENLNKLIHDPEFKEANDGVQNILSVRKLIVKHIHDAAMQVNFAEPPIPESQREQYYKKASANAYLELVAKLNINTEMNVFEYLRSEAEFSRDNGDELYDKTFSLLTLMNEEPKPKNENTEKTRKRKSYF